MFITLITPLFIGLILGLIGGGGSVLAVPALVYIYGFSTKPAIAMSLFVVGLSALSAVMVHGHKKDISFKSIIPFILSGMTGSYLSARFLAPLFSDSLQLVLFALMVVLISLYMFLKRDVREQDDDSQKKPRYFISILVGLILGSVTGIIGVGGGFLIVPALIMFLGMQLHTAIASSLIIIAVQSFAGLIAYLDFVNLDFKFIGIFSLIFMVGSMIGAKFSSRVPALILSKVFAVLLFFIGLFVVFKELKS